MWRRVGWGMRMFTVFTMYTEFNVSCWIHWIQCFMLDSLNSVFHVGFTEFSVSCWIHWIQCFMLNSPERQCFTLDSVNSMFCGEFPESNVSRWIHWLLFTVESVCCANRWTWPEEGLTHRGGLRDALAPPGALRVAEAAARLHTAAGLHRQVQAQCHLRSSGGAHAQYAWNGSTLRACVYIEVVVVTQ